MKKRQTLTVEKIILLFFIALATLITTASCASIDTRAERSTGQIFLYGEAHGDPRIMDRQLEIWREYYHNQNMRHLFIEAGFFAAELLNRWMQSDNDDILYELFDDWTGTAKHIPHTLVFYRTIKREFPETIFHGVDVGHQFWSTGERFLQYLRDSNMQNTEQYLLTLEAIEQGKYFYRYHEFGPRPAAITEFDMGFRVTRMTENFIREFDRLDGQNVMGIFGAAHIAFGYMQGFSNVPTMAQRLRERYGDSLQMTDLTGLTWLLLTNPIRVDTISINNIDYKASYFGTDFTVFRDIVSLSFWRLENAYDDFSSLPSNIYWLPFDNYPMAVEMNQVFIVDITFADGSMSRHFYRSSGNYWQGIPITTGFDVD